jgi:hypothetical protein
MQEYALCVGDELVLEGGIHLALLAVEGSEALLAITLPHPDDLGATGNDTGGPPMTASPLREQRRRRWTANRAHRDHD